MNGLLAKFFVPARGFWGTFRIAQRALGKYIVTSASLLHLGWATLLMLDNRAGNATALRVLFALTHNNISEVVLILIAVAFSAILFLNVRIRRICNVGIAAALLLPQQLVLLFSSGAAVYSICVQQYADGTSAAWSHIFADQLPVMILSFLYTVVILEASRPPMYTRVDGQPVNE